MYKAKEIWITGLALFSLFFGAGNLILPPFLGIGSGTNWYLVVVGFAISAVFIPVLGILAHAKLQGSILDFGTKISPLFSITYSAIVYAISISLPAPRTASVTHEMAVAPFFNSTPLVTSLLYFAAVFFVSINRHKIASLIGRYLTPLIVLILLLIIGMSVFNPTEIQDLNGSKPFLITGFLEGYQTFDAIGAVVVGAVLIISIKFKSGTSYLDRKKLLFKAGLIAGGALLIIYGGLIYAGALFESQFTVDATRAQILSELSLITLGAKGRLFLSVLVALACFTTAVGIVTGTADFISGFIKNNNKAFRITVFVGCLIGVLVGQLDVHYIITIAVPALLFIYPITIALIVLNVLPERYSSKIVFRAVVLVTFLSSLPEVTTHVTSVNFDMFNSYFPFYEYSLGWLLPAFLAFVLANLYNRNAMAAKA